MTFTLAPKTLELLDRLRGDEKSRGELLDELVGERALRGPVTLNEIAEARLDGDERTAFRIDRFLAELHQARGGLRDRDATATWRLAQLAVFELARPLAERTKLVHRLVAVADGFDDDANVRAITELAGEVERFVGFRRIGPLHGGQESMIRETAPVALREVLAARYPHAIERIPPTEKLAAFLDRHVEGRHVKRTTRGKLTTAGIVAELLLALRVHGTTAVTSRKNVLGRVDNALRRARKASLGLRGPYSPFRFNTPVE